MREKELPFDHTKHSIRKRLEEYCVHVTVEIGEGLYHSYAMLPLVKEAEEGYPL